MRAEDDRYSEIIEDQHLLYLLRQFRFLWPNPLTPRSDKHETSPTLQTKVFGLNYPRL